MSRAWTPEFRRCRFCDAPQMQVYADGTYYLVKYGVRHYAHPACLARKEGLRRGRAMIPEHQRRSYDAELAGADDWTIAAAEHADDVRDREEATRKRLAGEP